MRELIDALAQEHGGSRAALARASGVDEGALSRMWHGKEGLGLETLRRLLRATASAELQAALLREAGISDAILEGQGVAVKHVP